MNKVMSLHDAVAKYVENGDVLATGGFTTNRKPYAAVSEILRQGQKDFIVYAGATPACRKKARGKGVKMLLKSSQVQVFLQKEKGSAAKSVESNSRIRQKWQKIFGYFFLIFFAFFID